jgi:hypothetical protein
VKPTRQEIQAKREVLEAKVKEWGIDLKKFRARAARAKGSAKNEIDNDVTVLRSKLAKAKARLEAMKKSGNAASAELVRGVGKARADLRKAFKRAKAKLE